MARENRFSGNFPAWTTDNREFVLKVMMWSFAGHFCFDSLAVFSYFVSLAIFNCFVSLVIFNSLAIGPFSVYRRLCFPEESDSQCNFSVSAFNLQAERIILSIVKFCAATLAFTLFSLKNHFIHIT